MHHICDTEITQCETKKKCVAKMSSIRLVQQKKILSFEIYNLCPVMSSIIYYLLTAPKMWKNIVLHQDILRARSCPSSLCSCSNVIFFVRARRLGASYKSIVFNCLTSPYHLLFKFNNWSGSSPRVAYRVQCCFSWRLIFSNFVNWTFKWNLKLEFNL